MEGAFVDEAPDASPPGPAVKLAPTDPGDGGSEGWLERVVATFGLRGRVVAGGRPGGGPDLGLVDGRPAGVDVFAGLVAGFGTLDDEAAGSLAVDPSARLLLLASRWRASINFEGTT